MVIGKSNLEKMIKESQLINRTEYLPNKMTIADILNYFASDGWELVYMDKLREEYSDYEEYQIIFKRRRKGDKL